METSLHRTLKDRYAGPDGQTEVRVNDYRIDVVRDDKLVEIQHGSLVAIRDKIAALLVDHNVLVVKPIILSKHLVRQHAGNGQVIGRRLSPKRGSLLDLFDDLVHFIRVFPHERLTLEALLIDIEEWRYPGHGRRRRWRAEDYVVEDQRLVAIRGKHRYTRAADLLRLLPTGLRSPFNTADLAQAWGVARWVAQQAAYCFRKTGGTTMVGRRRTGYLYELVAG